ncbi:MAG TPA: MGMT family protein [Caproiciproducens sp.]|nr:MGMT family protein [Caproiciproducens sp.]
MLGRSRAAREVGWAMRCCPDGLLWQRVVKKDGTIEGDIYAVDSVKHGIVNAIKIVVELHNILLNRNMNIIFAKCNN